MVVVNPRDAPLTREQVHGIIQGWYKAKNLRAMPPLKDYLRDKVGIELAKVTKFTQVLKQTENAGLKPVEIVDMILDDLDSYIPPEKQNA